MRTKALQTAWVKHLPEGKEKEDFISLVRNSRLVLGRLKDVLDEQLQGIARTEGSPETYDSGYPYLQAYMNGRRQAFLDLRKLVEFLD